MRIVTAVGKYLAHSSIFIEYPFLDHSEWSALTPELFLRNFQTVAPQIGLVVDYLHMMGMVHCDLKLENFLIRTTPRTPRVVMMDLDFLCRENSVPEARVFGTPDHIAPEILANDRIVAQSDLYSLGISMGRCLKDLESSPMKSGVGRIPADEKLAELVAEMTQQDYLRRPRFLLDSLHLYRLIDKSTFEETRKSLLAMLLVSRYRTTSPSDLESSRGMEKFIRRDNKILGPEEEFIDDLAAAYKADRRRTFGVFKSLLAEAAVERHADYWHAGLDDSHLLHYYRRLAELARPGNVFVREADQAQLGLSQDLAIARRLADDGHIEFAYLHLKQSVKESQESGEHAGNEREEALKELVSLARLLNRLSEADEFLSALFDLNLQRGVESAEILFDRVNAHVILGRLKEAEELMATWLPKMSPTLSKRLELEFDRVDAWIRQNRGEYSQAMEMLERILGEARQQGLHDLAVLILYNIGVLFWRQGNFKRSEEYLLASYELAERENLLDGATSVISTISQLAWEQADYARAIKFGKLASKLLSSSRRPAWFPSVCSNIANAEIRLADYPKAEYWLQRYLSAAPAGASRAYLLTYYLQEGYFEYNQGEIAAARDSFHKARQLLDSTVLSPSAGKVYHNLAELALCQGQSSECEEYLAEGRRIFGEKQQQAALAELDFIGLLNEFYYGEVEDPSQLIDQAKSLLEKNCRYYAILCLFHSVLHARKGLLGEIRRLMEPLKEVIRQPGPPLFKAMSCVMEALDRHEGEEQLPVTTWKEVFAVLLAGQQKFPAMHVGVSVADRYTETSNSKHAKKFLLQSLKLAEDLGNKPMERMLKKRLERVSRTTDNSARLIDSFHGISEILTNLGDYRQSLQRLIKFAVDQTGAERGVIFLKTREGADLTVAASLNCDDQSLSDIRDFSRNIPQAMMKDLSPLIIENALSDQRTNQYASIVYHNILSVICVPLSKGSETLGALYLDHHTIPALFDKEDLTFITSVANFISVALATARDIRSRLLTSLQMQQDLGRLGGNQTFITEDRKLLDLFKKLPQIAATKTPVLIFGENGTGKEIVGEMIHRYSPRRDKPHVKLNCAAIPEDKIESELFGVAKSAFTDVAERDGRFSAADGGTLYLDEIGALPQAAQPKVLRVLEYQEFQKLGSNHTILTDVRFVYATNQNLHQMVKDGTFREDLLYRINTITIEISPLRDRPGDVPVLIEHFLSVFGVGKAAPRFSTAAMDTLMAYYWPGNVRELKNTVERFCILHPGSVITKEMLPPEIRGTDLGGLSNKKIREKQEAERILKALIKHNWNQTKAAEELGIPLSTLRRKIKKYNIRRPD